MRSLFILLGLCFSLSITAQETGQKDYPALGISFTIPDGWLGQEGQGVYMMGSNSIPGLVLVMPSSVASLDAMRQEARTGVVDQATGTNLQLSTEIENLSSQAIGAEFSGLLEQQQAKAYLIGAYNPHGQSVTIMAVTLTNMYDEKYPAVAKKVWQSLKFRKPVIPPVVDQWTERISGTRLTYMESYSSIDYSNPGYTSGGGYSKEEKIDLCPAGFFNYNDRFDMSVSAPSVSGNANNRDRGAGRWTVIANAQGQPVLQLHFSSGEVYEYVLSTEGDKTFLNGKRYFRTWTGENAPVCN